MAIVSERKIVINDRTYLLLRRITRGGPHKYTRKTAKIGDGTPAYPYGALVPEPPNFGGLEPEGLIPFTKFCPSWSMSDATFTESWQFGLPFGQLSCKFGKEAML
jgi:hypothetical protein